MPGRGSRKSREASEDRPSEPSPTPRIVCAWCGSTMRGGDPAQSPLHGVCDRCSASTATPVIEDLARAVPDRLECLPFGVIRLKGDGEIVSYTTQESRISGRRPEEVIGTHFFRDLAPCAQVRDFLGRFEALRAAGRNGREEFFFVFRFPQQAVAVKVAIAYDAAGDVTTLLIRPLG